MKIAHIVRTSQGGMLSHIKVLLSMLVEKGYDICLIGDFDDVTERWFESLGIKVYRVVFNNDSNIFSLFIQAIKIASILKKEKPDVVHMHGYIASVVGRLACTVDGVYAAVVTVHNYMPDRSFLRKFFVLMEKILSRRTKAYIAVSEALKAHMIEQMGIPEGKIRTIYNGIPDPIDRGAKDSVKELKGKKRVISVARLIPQKGVEYLIRAADEILKERDDVEFFVLGDGPQRSQLEGLIKALNREEQVKLLGYRDDVDALLKNSDVFVLPSFSEGMPVSVIEAMRAGKPIVATEVGGIPEEVVDGVNGLLVKPGDVGRLKEAILYFLDDPERGQRYGLKGYERYKKLFSAGKMCEKVIRVYSDVLCVK